IVKRYKDWRGLVTHHSLLLTTFASPVLPPSPYDQRDRDQYYTDSAPLVRGLENQTHTERQKQGAQESFALARLSCGGTLGAHVSASALRTPHSTSQFSQRGNNRAHAGQGGQISQHCQQHETEHKKVMGGLAREVVEYRAEKRTHA